MQFLFLDHYRSEPGDFLLQPLPIANDGDRSDRGGRGKPSRLPPKFNSTRCLASPLPGAEHVWGAIVFSSF